MSGGATSGLSCIKSGNCHCLKLQASDQAKHMEEAGSFRAAAEAAAEAAERQREASKVRPDWAPSNCSLMDCALPNSNACWHALAVSA